MSTATLLATAPSYPVPPVNISADRTGSFAFLVLCSAFMIIMVVHAVRNMLRGELLLMACMIGGLVAGSLEPILDYLGLLWFAEDNVLIAVETVERHIPLYVVMGYAFFFGYQAYLAYRAVLAGKSARFFVGFYVASWLFDLFLQATGRALGLYEYYGNQPYLIFGVPAWWISMDAVLALLAAVMFVALRDKLRGAGAVLVIPLLPAAYAGLNGAVGWPVFTALNSNYEPAINGNGEDWQVWLGGTATIGLSLLFVWLLIDRIGTMQRHLGITRGVIRPHAPATHTS